MGFDLDTAREDDIAELLTLYRDVYGAAYTLPLGSDSEAMRRELLTPESTWLVVKESGRIVGSIVGGHDRSSRIGKLQGLVIHPEARGQGAAELAVRELSALVLGDGSTVDSVYATARTNSTGPQRLCLNAGFRATGVLPDLRGETMVLLVRHHRGVLDLREAPSRVLAPLAPLMAAVNASLGVRWTPEVVDAAPPPSRRLPCAAVDVLDAPAVVARRLAASGEGFYPLHTPNLLLTPADRRWTAYAHLNGADGYCALSAASLPAVGEDLEAVVERLTGRGARHIAVFVPADDESAVLRLLAHRFLPAACYPAVRTPGEGVRDVVVMARLGDRPDLSGIALHDDFRPFAEQYTSSWERCDTDLRGYPR